MTAVLAITLALVIGRPWRSPPRRIPGPSAPAPPRRWPARAGGPLWGVLVGASAMVLPLVTVPVLLWPSATSLLRTRRAATADAEAVTRALPDAVDLLVIGVGAGATPRAAIATAAPWLPEPIGPALRRAVARSDRGEPLAVALATTCGPLGDPLLPLVALLSDTELGGGAVLPGLVRIGDEARRRRRAEAQERARRLPVVMLLPLIVCVLPSVALVGIAPLLFAALGDFRFVS